MKRQYPAQLLKRRNFLKLSGAGILSLPLMFKSKLSFGKSGELKRKGYWEGPEGSEYCVHRTVYTGELESGYIWARVDGIWKRYTVRDLEETFWDWNFEERIASFEAQLVEGVPYVFSAGGPHSPSVASYGNRKGRGDSDFHLNNKIVSTNCVLDKAHIKELNDTMLQMIKNGADSTTKIAYLNDIYKQQDIWLKNVQVTLDLSSPAWQSHTFLNLMENPVATLCFQGGRGANIFKSFEIRCIARIIHPQDPAVAADADLYQLAIFPSILMGFYHGFVPEHFTTPAIFYYAVEEFNNSVDSMGKRLVNLIRQKLDTFFA